MTSFYKTAFHFIGLLALFSLLPAKSHAQSAEKQNPQRIYDIEIVIFKNIKTPKGEESILPILAPSIPSNHVALFEQNKDIDGLSNGFILPNTDEKRLQKVANHIKRSSRYQLLTHQLWRQAGLAKNNAIPVLIRTGKAFDNTYSSIDLPVNKNNIDDTNPLETNQKVWYELEGKITISLARYLHAYVDLVLRVPSENQLLIEEDQTNTPQETSFKSATLNNFLLKEHRRMRSKKLHYIDHPEFAMLILITPYEANKNEENG